MPSLHAVVMAGGSGTRFWPASRSGRPKQFLPLADGQTLIAATIARLRGVCDAEHTWIVTNAAQAAMLPGLLPDFPKAQVIVEPQARDTAPCREEGGHRAPQFRFAPRFGVGNLPGADFAPGSQEYARPRRPRKGIEIGYARRKRQE